MARAKNCTLLSNIDCPGGGQVWVENATLFVGHMRHPSGTSIYDVEDPRKPRLLAHLEVPPGWHSHKVRVADDIMIVNYERLGADETPEFGGGIGIYDVSDPARPRQIGKWRTAGRGVHRYDFDGRFAYISPSAEGFVGNIVMVLDLEDPATPREVGRWWIPGQWKAGGEAYPWDDRTPPRCHHPLRHGDRLYVSYWHHGFFILDISEMAKPKVISSLNTTPVYPHPTHTCLVVPTLLKGRKIMVVADEDVAKLWPAAPAFTWIYDITEERMPVSIATWQVEGLDPDGQPQPPMMGCHQPSERFNGSIIPFAWFAKGLRLLDIRDPYAPKEVGFYEPDPPAGFPLSSSNDVTIDKRGLVYLVDRQRGVDIIDTSVW